MELIFEFFIFLKINNDYKLHLFANLVDLLIHIIILLDELSVADKIK